MKLTRALLPLLLACTSAAQAQTPFQKVIELSTDPVEMFANTPTSTSDGGCLVYVVHDPALSALVKLDPNGDPLWSKAYPVVAGEAWSASQTVPTIDGGAVILLKQFGSPAPPSRFNFVLARIDASGVVMWSKRYTVWVDDYPAFFLAELMSDPGDGFFVHVSYSITAGTTTHRLLKLNASGNVLWCNSISDWAGADYMKSLYAVPGGGCLLVQWGGSVPLAPIRIALMDADGNLVWARSVRMNSGSWTFIPGMAIASSAGEVYLLGDQTAGGAGDDRGFLIKIAATGDLDWYRLYDGIYLRYADEAIELSSGDLRFGSTDANVFNTDGQHLFHRKRSFPSITAGSMSYALSTGHAILRNSDTFLQAAEWTEHDDVFNVTTSYKNIISSIPWDLINTCGWDSTSIATAPDTMVPPAYIEYLTLNNSDPWPFYSQADTTIASLDVAVSVSDFCTLLSVGDVPAPSSPLTVFPSLLQAGTPINAHAQDAARMELFDARGRSVQVLSAEHDAQVSFNSSALRRGLYLIRAVDARGALLGTARVVVE